MSNNIDTIIKIADSVGLKESAANVASTIAKIGAREKVYVAFIGGQNSGKTSVINAVVGRTIKEPSNISDDKLPLRVVFEKTEADERFECIEVYDKAWNEEDAVLFEFKSDEIVKNAEIKTFSHEIDVIYYLISAINPFTSEDVETIKTLSDHRIKIIVTKLDTIDDKNKAGVTKYIDDVRISLGLDEPIFIDKTTKEDCGKIIRNSLPVYGELKEIRANYCNALLRSLSETMEIKIDDRINALIRCNSEATLQDETINKAQCDALATKNELLRLGLARSKRYESEDALEIKLAKALIDSGRKQAYSNEWQNSLRKSIIEPLIEEEFRTERKKTQELLFEDCSGINPTKEESIELQNLIDSLSGMHTHTYDVPSQNIKSSEASINLKTVGITVAVVAGAVIVPIPTLTTWIVSVGAIAVGAGAVIAEKAKEENDMWAKNIKDYATVVSKKFYESMIIFNNGLYEKLSDYMYEKIINEYSKKNQSQENSVNADIAHYKNMLTELKKLEMRES